MTEAAAQSPTTVTGSGTEADLHRPVTVQRAAARLSLARA